MPTKERSNVDATPDASQEQASSPKASSLEKERERYRGAQDEEKQANADLGRVKALFDRAPAAQRPALERLVEAAQSRVDGARGVQDELRGRIEAAHKAWSGSRRETIQEVSTVLEKAVSKYEPLEKLLLANDAEEQSVRDLADTAAAVSDGAMKDDLMRLWGEGFEALASRLTTSLQQHGSVFTEEISRLNEAQGNPGERFQAYLRVKEDVAHRLHDPEGLIDRERRKREHQKERLSDIREKGGVYLGEEEVRERTQALKDMPALDLALTPDRNDIDFKRRQGGYQSDSARAGLAVEMINLAELRKFNILQLVDPKSLVPLDEVKKHLSSFSSNDSLQGLLAASGKTRVAAYIREVQNGDGKKQQAYESVLTRNLQDLVGVLTHLPDIREYESSYRLEGAEVSARAIDACRAAYRHIDVVLPILKVCAASVPEDRRREYYGASAEMRPTIQWAETLFYALQNDTPKSRSETLVRLLEKAKDIPGLPTADECERALKIWDGLVKSEGPSDPYSRKEHPPKIQEDEYKKDLALREGELQLQRAETTLLRVIKDLPELEEERTTVQAEQDHLDATGEQRVKDAQQAVYDAEGEWARYRDKVDEFNREYPRLVAAANKISDTLNERQRQIEGNQGKWFKGGANKALEGEMAELRRQHAEATKAYQDYDREMRPREPQSDIRRLKSALEDARRVVPKSRKMEDYLRRRDERISEVSHVSWELRTAFKDNKALAAKHPGNFYLTQDRQVYDVPGFSDWPYVRPLKQFCDKKPVEPLPTVEELSEIDQRLAALGEQNAALGREVKRLQEPWGR